MSCRYKKECPSYSGWCEGPKQDFSRCVQFLINAYESEKEKNKTMSKGLTMTIEHETRACKVGGRFGYFHCWEHFSKPLAASPFVGGAPAGVFSKVFGIVEFAEGVERVDPTKIRFSDEENAMLKGFDEIKEKEGEKC